MLGTREFPDVDFPDFLGRSPELLVCTAFLVVLVLVLAYLFTRVKR